MPAVTSVTNFSDGNVLTASALNAVNCGIHVYTNSTTRDAAYGGSGERTLVAGEFAYLLDDLKLYVYNGTSWTGVSSMRKVTRFTASGTFTPPTGVTYAIAHIIGGGGGVGSGCDDSDDAAMPFNHLSGGKDMKWTASEHLKVG